ncbi:alpha-xenorhabdolysin family binary toxin subunit B [Pseudomonas sp. RT4P38]
MTTLLFTAPDMSLIRDSRETIRYQAIIGSADLYIEALRNELLKLNAEITSTDQAVSRTLTSAIISLDTKALRDTLEALVALTEDETNAETEKVIQSYTKIADQLITMCTEKLDELQTELSHAVFSVKNAPISNNRFRIAELAEAREALAAELDKEKPPVDLLLEDEKTLNKAISLFESLTFIDRLKPLFAQLTGMIGTQPETPETAAMKAGLVVANKLLDEANELIKYQGLIKARTTLRVRLNARQERLDSLVAQMSDNDKKTKQLNDTKKVIEPRNIYADETSKIVESLSQLLDAITQDAENDIIKKGHQLVAHAKSFTPHLENLRGQWLRG